MIQFFQKTMSFSQESPWLQNKTEMCMSPSPPAIIISISSCSTLCQYGKISMFQDTLMKKIIGCDLFYLKHKTVMPTFKEDTNPKFWANQNTFSNSREANSYLLSCHTQKKDKLYPFQEYSSQAMCWINREDQEKNPVKDQWRAAHQMSWHTVLYKRMFM